MQDTKQANVVAINKNTETETQSTESEAKAMSMHNKTTQASQTETSSADIEKTPNTSAEQPKNENKTDAKAKKAKKAKRVVKRTITRDEAAIKEACEFLQTLKKERAKVEMSDRQLVERMISEIMDLKESGIGYAQIHIALREKLELQISTQTFISYVQAALGKDRPKRDPKTVRISVPKEFAGKIEKLVSVLEKGLNVACLAFDETKWKGRLDIGNVPDIELEFATTIPSPKTDKEADSEADTQD